MSVLGMRLLVLFISIVVSSIVYMQKRRDRKIDEMEQKMQDVEINLSNARQDLGTVRKEFDVATKGLKGDISDLEREVGRTAVLTEKTLKEIIKNEFISFENRLLKKGFKL